MPNHASPESDLLSACMQWEVRGDPHGSVAATANRVHDWPRFLEYAEEQGLAALAADCLHRCAVNVPPDIRLLLKTALTEGAKRHLVMSTELKRLLALFETAGIPVITLKGPALAEAIYPDPAHRFSGDLDLVIHKDDFERTSQLLGGEGYREPGDAHLRRARAAFRKWNYEALFLHSTTRIAIDLHWSLMPRGFPICFSTAEIWKRSRGTRLAPADELAYLIAHDAKHEDSRASRNLDILLLMKAHPELERNQPQLATTLAWKLRLAAIPTEADWLSLPGLPRALFFLYFPWRLLRLSAKYLATSIRSDST